MCRWNYGLSELSSDPDHAPDQPSASDFWTQVWFKLDTKPWAITSGQKLEGRFGWVLEYILEGECLVKLCA